jgi:hypothetical protein
MELRTNPDSSEHVPCASSSQRHVVASNLAVLHLRLKGQLSSAVN